MSLLAALGSAVSSAIGPAISTAGSLYANRQNLKNQDYWNNVSIELANTAHQREMADLEAAGLNPILAANSGASTPSLSAATVGNPTVSFAQSARQLQNALTGQTKAEVEQAKADASSAKAYADNAKRVAAAEADLAESQARLQSLENDAKADALDGSVSLRGYQGSGGSYGDLVELYKKEIETGNYKSSLGHAIYDDIRAGISSASALVGAAKDIKGMIPERPSRDVKSVRYLRDSKGRIIDKTTNSRRFPR